MKKQLKFKQIPGFSKLFHDFIAGKAGDYYQCNFLDNKVYHALQEQIKQNNFQRESLTDILSKQNQYYFAGTKTLENIQKLNNPETTAVLTGQQVIMFGGPLFTFYKAATAIKLANKLSKSLGKDVVPIFWLASDDADFDEVAAITLPTIDNKLVTLKYQPHIKPHRQPMTNVKLDATIIALLDEYLEKLPQTEFTPKLKDVLIDCYRQGISVVTAFAILLTYCFKEYGLIVVDPSDQNLRKLALPFINDVIASYDKGVKAVESEDKKLQENGYHLQVNRSAQYSHLFYQDNQRRRIDFADNSFKLSDYDFTIEQLTELAERSPEKISTNVFLRPILQSYLFPTIAHVVGPAEVAYIAQIKSLYNLYNVEPPMIVPRYSGLVIEKNMKKLLSKYEIEVEDIFANIDSLISDHIRQAMPTNLEASLQLTRTEIAEKIQELIAKLDRGDSGLLTTANKTAGRIENELKNLEKKVLQSYKKKNQLLTSQLNKLSFNLYPHSSLQERSFPLNYYLARYGFNFINYLYNQIDLDTSQHHLIYLEEL